MAKTPLLERLREGTPLLSDGAMGTLVHQRGATMDACFDALNLSDPALIESIHRDYLMAGAQMVETNTFGANAYKLAEYGLGEQVATINSAAVAIARRAIAQAGREDDTYIAGSVGPIGARLTPYGRIRQDEMRAAFAEQIAALAQAGADAILLETFSDHAEILEALAAARSVAPGVPVICQMTFGPDARTVLGFSPARVAHELYKAGADVIGVNCSTGPAQIAHILQTMHDAVPDALFSAMPNAGFPEAIGGRVMYPAKADYFGHYAQTFRAIGANIIGGCCGTTPAHIAAMKDALKHPASDSRTGSGLPVIEINGDETDAPRRRPTRLMERLAQGEFTVTVEMAPPRSSTIDKVVHSARMLRQAGADVLNVADTPAARMRMSAWAVANAVQNQVGIETILHFPTRGRNLLRVQGDLLAAHALDLRNLFVVMGDPTRIGDYPEAMDQYDIAPSKLIDLIKHRMNEGVDLSGSSIGGPTTFTVGCALNMFADDLDHEIKVLGNKLDAGADFALGQAVFEAHKIETFHRRYEAITGESFRLPVLMGIMPLYSLKQAQFLHNEVPGIRIPDAIFRRLEDAGDDAPQEGVRIAQELLRDARGLVAGAYIIPAFGRYDLAAEVIDVVAVAR
jgi:homocysteine S-methyltransferase